MSFVTFTKSAHLRLFYI